jgi:diaminohydroxyphosphoribosylaminopyrimidine deaminase/5-amino-6-(5-phosphoribosylamino)uracil reductase
VVFTPVLTLTFTPTTRQYLPHALTLATQSINLTSPNPRVGCVLVNAAGEVIGQGATQRAGGPHAEVMALRDAAARGQSTRGATAFVTLEPCSHFGRTPPCADALVAAGISKVIATNADPNPAVAGKGFEKLRVAGVAVEVLPADDPLAIQARELNIGFFSRMIRNTPWVRMKLAASLDGVTALPNGQSQWITSAAARADGHAWRARACALLTGIGTVLADNPRLDVRHITTPRQPSVVLVDSHLEVPLDAALFIADRPFFIYTTSQNSSKIQNLTERAATVVVLPGPGGKVDLAAMMRDLAQRGVNELHVEAGHKLNGSLIRAGLVDEFLLYLAPQLLGVGAGLTNLGPLTDLNQSIGLVFQSVDRVGPDLRILARIPGRQRF